MRKILVTGGSGFLGSRICVYLKKRNYEVDAPSHGKMEITSLESVRKYLKAATPDLVIHCAAVSDTGYAEKHPEESFLVNVTGTRNLAKVTKELGIRFLFMSSDQIYNGKTIMRDRYEKSADASTEGKEECPVNAYGRQKKEAEEKSFLENPETIALRLTWMYDVERKGMKNNRNLLTNLTEADRKQERLKFARYEYRGITNVWEVIANLEKVFKIPPGIYNYGSENEYATIEIAKKAAEILGVSKETVREDKDRFADRPRNLTMCCDKIKKEGIFFHSTWEGLEDFSLHTFPGDGTILGHSI